MRVKFFLFSTLTTIASIFTGPNIHAECLGKVELAPAYIHIDVIESRNTIKELDMAGVRGDLYAVFGRGWLIKPTALYGKERDGEIVSFGLGFGRCIPIKEKWIFTPSVGVSYTTFGTSIHLDLGHLGELKFKERFSAVAPFVCLEVTYRLACDWRLSGSAQYSWSHSKTRVKDFFTTRSDAEGPAYSLQLEYDITNCWSINAAVAYNESYSREKNGIRGRGGKIGIVRWF